MLLVGLIEERVEPVRRGGGGHSGRLRASGGRCPSRLRCAPHSRPNPERAVVVVTHDTRLYGYADLFAIMSDGRIAKIARKEEMASSAAPEPHP